MISVDFSQPSTWRGIAMVGAGIAGGWYMLPEIQSLSSASTPDQVQFFLSKTTALATAIGLFGQTVSGMIGILFSDKQ